MTGAETERIEPAVVRSGVSLIVGATAIAGVAGYVITWWVARRIGFASYAVFAIFWAFLYLVVGSLAGIQQEVTRATRPVAPGSTAPDHRARNFGIVAAAIVFALVVATAPLWVIAVFPRSGWGLVWPLAVGAASYVLVAVLSGMLYGTSRWLPLAWMIVIDPVLRLVALTVVLLYTTEIIALAWVVVLPLPLMLVVVIAVIRRQVFGRSSIDVGYRRLTWNVLRIVIAAAGLSLMVSGFPLIFGITTRHDPAATVGLLILTITLTRAPLIVTVLALQSLLIVRFRDHTRTFWRTFFALQGLLMALSVVLAALGWLVGPAVFGLLFGSEAVPEGWFIAVLVASSALVAGMSVTASAVLSRSQHFVYSLGWVVAAAITVLSLMTPLDLIARTVLALIAGPLAGLVVHSVGLAKSEWARRAIIPRSRPRA